MKYKGWIISIVLTGIIFAGAYLPIFILGGFKNVKTLSSTIYGIWLLIFIICSIIIVMVGLLIVLVVLWVPYSILQWGIDKIKPRIRRYIENQYKKSPMYKKAVRRQNTYELEIRAQKIEKERKYAYKVKKVIRESDAFYNHYKNIRPNLAIPNPLKYGTKSLIYIPSEFLKEPQKANVTCFYCPKPENVYIYNDRKKCDRMQVSPSISCFIRDHVNSSQSQIRDYLNYQITHLGFRRFVSF